MQAAAACSRLPAIYINHGGGPLPLLGQQPDVAGFLSSYVATLPEMPRAVVVVTAHWEAAMTTVSSGERHSLLFDYSGFPPESYKYKYPAPGSPEVAGRLCELLQAAGLPHGRDDTRGWDHGVFVPMMLMLPDAGVPIVQLSLTSDQSAATQLAVGAALRPLRDEGVLLVGSGVSFHNFKWFFAREPSAQAAGTAHSRTFDSWLTAAVTDASLSTAARVAKLSRCDDASDGFRWRSTPSLRIVSDCNGLQRIATDCFSSRVVAFDCFLHSGGRRRHRRSRRIHRAPQNTSCRCWSWRERRLTARCAPLMASDCF